MIRKIKHIIKKGLVSIGFVNPSLGVKVRPEVKGATILEYKTPKLNVFVETGTEFGTMIKMIGDNFNKVYSIELDENLYNKAIQLFSEKRHIKLLQGDSGTEIKKILTELKEPALFWLDAHGHGSLTIKNTKHCPIESELRAIFAHNTKGHVILIDDARLFDLYSIYVIKKLAKENGYKFEVKDGIFRIYKK